MENVITVVNNVKIVELENNFIPIKPICDALGIAFSTQSQKINDDETLGSIVTLRVMVGSDNKKREMLCLPLKYIFGWLFTINPKNVKEEAKENVLSFRMQCYDAIFDSLFLSKIYLQEKEKQVEEKLKEIEFHKTNFHEAQNRLKQAEKALKELRQFTFDDWKLKQQQISMLDVDGF